MDDFKAICRVFKALDAGLAATSRVRKRAAPIRLVAERIEKKESAMPKSILRS